jgi:putative ABC transport system substrate-binding protein
MGMPLLASSEALVKVGALLSVVPDYAETGEQAAAIALQILEDRVAPSEIQVVRPESMRVVLNRGTLNRLKLSLDPMLLDFTDEVVDDEERR